MGCEKFDRRHFIKYIYFLIVDNLCGIKVNMKMYMLRFDPEELPVDSLIRKLKMVYVPTNMSKALFFINFFSAPNTGSNRQWTLDLH